MPRTNSRISKNHGTKNEGQAVGHQSNKTVQGIDVTVRGIVINGQFNICDDAALHSLTA